MGVNYYTSTNSRMMVNYLHTQLSKDAAGVPAGMTDNAVAARFQVNW